MSAQGHYKAATGKDTTESPISPSPKPRGNDGNPDRFPDLGAVDCMDESVKDADYLEFAADVLEECVRILKKHNDEEELEPTWDWPDDHKTDDPRRGQAKEINE